MLVYDWPRLHLDYVEYVVKPLLHAPSRNFLQKLIWKGITCLRSQEGSGLNNSYSFSFCHRIILVLKNDRP